jgi:UDP-glucose 4-epimerase
MFERCLAWVTAHGLKAIAFATSCRRRYLERGEARRDETHLIPLVFSAIQGRREAVDIFGTDYPTADGTCIRDYVHVGDIARAHLAGLERMDDIGFDFFNVAGESGHSVLDVVKSVEAVTGLAVPRVFKPRRPGDPAVLVASATKLRQKLGWTPLQSSMNSIIETAWQWRLASQRLRVLVGSATLDLTISIVSLNTRDLLAACLRTVMASTGVSFEVYVVDNGSHDGSGHGRT